MLQEESEPSHSMEVLDVEMQSVEVGRDRSDSNTPLSPEWGIDSPQVIESRKRRRFGLLNRYKKPKVSAKWDLDNYWSVEPAEIFKLLHSRESGLTSQEAEVRIAEVGKNKFTSSQKVSALILFLSQLKSPWILLLLVAVIVSASLGDYANSIIIAVIVFLSCVINFFQEYVANNAAEKLKQSVSVETTVLRNGQVTNMPAEEIVPGDIVLLSAGMLVPADGMVLSCKDFFVNQAVLTGETFPVEKMPGVLIPFTALTDRTNCVFMGTSVQSGNAVCLMIKTGLNSQYGHISKKVNRKQGKSTNFERGTRRFGLLLVIVMIVLVVAVFLINMLKPDVKDLDDDEPSDPATTKSRVLDSVMFSLALAVGLTPELLPLVISICLSSGARAMSKKQVIVRRLVAIENFGSMSVLCFDKTGTITMGAVHLDNSLCVEGSHSDQVMMYAYINSHFQTGIANPLDEAIMEKGKSRSLDVSGFKKVDEMPFESVRKRLSVVVSEEDKQSSSTTIITKGALIKVLEVCTHYYSTTEQRVLPLGEAELQEIEKKYEDWGNHGLRVLGLATKELPVKDSYSTNDEAELVFYGFLCFLDPCKPDSKEVISHLAEAGVRAVVITGDNKFVALHIAAKVGMDVRNVLTGKELSEMTEIEQEHCVSSTDLFVEVDPDQKEIIVQALRKAGEIVGFMGDGVNDVAALNCADVGISVNNAVDIAKEASDFVMLSHELTVLRDAIFLGRSTFANTMKYILLAVSNNFGNMLSVSISSTFLPFIPMQPLQILLLNFLNDIPQLAIAYDNVDPEAIQNPECWNLAFIVRFMVIFGPLSSSFDFSTFGIAYLLLRYEDNDWFSVDGRNRFRMAWWIESLFAGMIIVFVVRTKKFMFNSRPGKGLVVLTICIALLGFIVPYIPVVGPALAIYQLKYYWWLIILGLSVVYLFMGELTKFLFYKYGLDKPLKRKITCSWPCKQRD